MALVIAMAMVLTMMSMSAFAAFEYTLATEFVEGTTYYDENHNPVEIADATAFDDYLTNTGSLYTRSGEEDSGDSGDSGNTPSVTGASIELTQEPADYADKHTYNVYQIFTGDIGTDDSGKQILQNVKYGENYGDTGASVPKSVLDAVGTDARAYADDILNSLKNNPVAQLTQANNFKATGLDTGYYLIVDTLDGTLPVDADGLVKGDALSTYIVQVLDNVSINTKKDVTSSDKKITSDEHPASEGGDANPGLSADGKTDNVSIGDTVTFTITSKVPAHSTDYDYYYFIINDTLSEGLTFNGITSVKVGDTEMKKLGGEGVSAEQAEYALYTGDDAGDHTFEIALLKANTEDFAGKTITVVYTATLNEKAVIGGDGNLNTETVTYSNNPNEDYDGSQDDEKPGKPDSTSDVPLGETPDSTTKTFTSGIKLQKLDQDKQALAGASFTISGDSINKVVKNKETFEAADDGTYYKLKTGAYTTQAPQTADKMIAAPEGATDGYVVWQEGDKEEDKITVDSVDYRVVKENETPTHILQKKNSELYDSTTQKYKKTTTETVEETTDHVTQNLAVNADGTLNFEGLGAGTYTITETVVPAGYTKAQDVTVVITFDNETKKFTATVNGEAATADATTNLFPVDVINVAGNTLPETGGIGTTIFYVVGAMLVLGAGVVLITRRRMDA